MLRLCDLYGGSRYDAEYYVRIYFLKCLRRLYCNGHSIWRKHLLLDEQYVLVRPGVPAIHCSWSGHLYGTCIEWRRLRRFIEPGDRHAVESFDLRVADHANNVYRE